MKFVFDTIQEWPAHEAPAHVKRASIDWLRRNVREIGGSHKFDCLNMASLEEQPGTAISPSALHARWTFRNRVNGARLLVNAVIGQFLLADLMRLQLGCVDEDCEIAIITAAEFEDGVVERIERSNSEEGFAIAAFQLSLLAIGDDAFAPRFFEIVIPDGYRLLTRSKRNFAALAAGRTFEDARALRRAFWGRVRSDHFLWDKSKEGVDNQRRSRPIGNTGISVVQHVSFGNLAVWLACDHTPGSDDRLKVIEAHATELAPLPVGAAETGVQPCYKRYDGALQEEVDFELAVKWLKTNIDLYERVVAEILGKTT